MTRLYCATGNAGKLREFRLAADTARIEIELLPAFKSLPEAVEDGATFEENAIKKALHYGPMPPASSSPTIPAWKWKPSAARPAYIPRASPDRRPPTIPTTASCSNACRPANRKARFVCAIALVEGGNVLGVYHGAVEGEILHEPRGTGGFGYDPLFYCPAFGCTFGEATRGTETLAESPGAGRPSDARAAL